MDIIINAAAPGAMEAFVKVNRSGLRPRRQFTPPLETNADRCRKRLILAALMKSVRAQSSGDSHEKPSDQSGA